MGSMIEKTTPRPGNLWVILVQITATMCAAALIDNGLSDVAGPHGRVSFHSQFFAVVRASVMRIDCVLFPYCPVFPVCPRFDERPVK